MADNDDRSWRYELEEVGPDAEPAVEPIQPGSPSAESVAFFLLGVAVMVGILWLLIFG